MSGTLNWKPAQASKGTLPYELRKALEKRGLDGSPTMYNKHNLPYLHGLADAEVEGAQELIDLIEKYGCVELYIQY